MRRKLRIGMLLVVLVVGLLGGCTQDSNTGLDHSKDIKYFIGRWVNANSSVNSTGVNQSLMRIYNFTEHIFNYSAFAVTGSDSSYRFSEETYEIKDGTLIISNTKVVPPKKATFKYSFSYNYTALNLTDESGNSIRYLKTILQ